VLSSVVHASYNCMAPVAYSFPMVHYRYKYRIAAVVLLYQNKITVLYWYSICIKRQVVLVLVLVEILTNIVTVQYFTVFVQCFTSTCTT
jgi:hypothetical protein